MLLSGLKDFDHSLSRPVFIRPLLLLLPFLIFDRFSGLFLQHSKLRTAPPCKHVMVLRKYSKLVFLRFLPVKPGHLLSFWVTETPRAGVFRQQSVATVIPLSELSSQRYPGFFLPGPGLAPTCRGPHMAHSCVLTRPLRVSLALSLSGGHFHLPRDPPIIRSPVVSLHTYSVVQSI